MRRSLGLVVPLWIASWTVIEEAEAAADEVYSQDQLREIYGVAVQEFDLHADRCAAAVGAVGGDPAAEAAFVRSALMMRLVAENFSFPGGRESERSKMILRVILGYERAFDCNPVWNKRQYLLDAIDVAESHIKHVRSVERRALSESTIDAVIKGRQRVRVRLDGLREPSCPTKLDLCGDEEVIVVAPPAEPVGGYAGWARRLSLRVELGGGGVRTREESDDDDVRSGAYSVMVSAGSRFVVGSSTRHRFVLGGTYGLAGYEYIAHHSRMAHWLLLRAEYGIVAHPRWLTLQVGFEAGLGLAPRPRDEVTAHGLSGLSAGLCILEEILCARVRGFAPLRRPDFFEGIFGLLSVDVFRVVDQTLESRTRRAP